MPARPTIRRLLRLDDWPALTPGKTITVDGSGEPAALDLGSVDNTSDANKPVSTAQAAYTDNHGIDLPTANWLPYYSTVRYTRPVIVLRFDDSGVAMINTILPLLAARSLPAGFAIDWGTIPSSGLTVANLKTLQENGMEIMCHSRTHGADPATFAAFVDETATVTAEMRAQGLAVPSFTQPGTWVAAYNFATAASIDGNAVGAVFRSNFASMFAYVNDHSSGYGFGMPLPVGNRYGRNQGAAPTSLATAILPLNKVAASHIQNYTFHPGQFGQAGQITLADFTTFLDALVVARDAGLVQVLSPTGSRFAQYGSDINLCADPGFEQSVTGTWYGWQILGGTPTVVAGGVTGNCAKVNSANSIYLYVGAPASLRFTGYAKAVTGSTSARVVCKNVDANATTVGTQLSTSVAITDAGWTKISFTFGGYPDPAIATLVWLFANGTDYVLWDDISIVRV